MLLADFPHGAVLLEVLHQEARGQPPADLELAVAAGLRARQHVAGHVARDDPDVPSAERWRVFTDRHRDTVGFLSGRTRRAPDVQRPFRRSRGDERGQDRLGEHPEHPGIPEKRRLVVRHRLHDSPVEIAERSAAEAGDHLLERGESLLARQRIEPRFDEVFLAGLERQRRLIADQVADVAVVARRHDRRRSYGGHAPAGGGASRAR